MTQLVLCGPTRFHAIDEEATIALRKPRVRELLAEHAPLDDYCIFERGTRQQLEHARLQCARLRDELRKLGLSGSTWSFRRLGWIANAWEPGYAVPQCGMVSAAVAVPISEARARGLAWSLECARRNGIGSNPLLSSRVATATCRYRAYRHAVDCEVCWNEGIRHCEIFPLIARGEIESDVDPRLEELLA